MKVKFVRKYMHLAEFIAKDQPVCPSRQIGAVIVDPICNKILGTGYNGPPPGTPHTTSEVYLREFFWPQLTTEEQCHIGRALGVFDTKRKEAFIKEYKDTFKCPRQLIGAKSGQRSELCSCGHAEVNAIINASQSCRGAYMFCWCGVPCQQCTHAIIMARIHRIYCLAGTHYHSGSIWTLEQAQIQVIELKPGDLNET